jgi:hypothetical protein
MKAVLQVPIGDTKRINKDILLTMSAHRYYVDFISICELQRLIETTPRHENMRNKMTMVSSMVDDDERSSKIPPLWR